ncbi:uncharacterized protein LOC106664488 isoform X2 [Cimex lectularius]|uniref:Uncharacterized protein n=1 Tax=Cimex lectularius TaxID=79782 RepID=A0A8I6RL43_CIMLE|nr:uncharacterized protein LOC106664488 isoform X2 [Cimex lectularius]
MDQGVFLGIPPMVKFRQCDFAENGVTEYGDGCKQTIPKKEKDSRIAELEQQLAIAENRCTTLRKQVEYMRLLYDGVEKPVEGGEAGFKTKEDKRRGDPHFFPERQQRTKQCIVSEHNVFNENFLTDFNEGFVSEITGSKQHVGKDPKDVVQIILSGMTRSINDMSDPDLQMEPDMKPSGAQKKSQASTEPKKLEPEGVRVKPKGGGYKGKMTKNQEDSAKIVRTSSKKSGKKETPGGNKINTRQTGKANSNKSSNAKMKKITKPMKATKPTSFKNKNQMMQGSFQYTLPPPSEKTMSYAPKDNCSINRRKSKSSCEYVKSTYQLPTVSYRMKCVPKSLNAHFNIKSIPFVVGMSTNKSHNLGMKVQETLSLIKLNNRSAISQTALADPDCELGGLLKYCPSQVPFGQARSRYVVGHGSLGNVKKPKSLLQAKASSVSMGTSVDYKNYQLRNVLVNLHDEFSKMTTKYDELKELVKTKKDPEADKELQKLEEELTTKENEINAIMGLYNEVSDLKDKLTYMEKRSSSTSLFVSPDAFSQTISTNGLKMTRLLRKIEEFQDSLKANTFV